MVKRPHSPDEVPETVPVFPLTGALLLPHAHRPLNIFEPRYVAMVDRALAADRLIGLIQPVDASEESPAGRPALREVGCLGRIMHFEEQDDDRYFIILEGIARFEIVAEKDSGGPFRMCAISSARFAGDFDPETGEEAVDRDRFIKMMHEYADFAQIDVDWTEIEQTGTTELVNFACMVSPYGAAEKQALLEAETLVERAETLIALAEIEMARARPGRPLQ